MYRELILRTNMLDLPIFALIVFVAVFAILAFRVMRQRDWSEVSALPLETEESAAPQEGPEVRHGQA
jgi:hypothetical protein